MKDLCRKIDEFAEQRNWKRYHTPKNLTMSIAIEAAELMECFQWNDGDIDNSNPEEELADVMIYCLRLSSVLGIDMRKEILNKLEKNGRKYPICKDDHSND